MIQQSLSVLCLATSATVKVLVMIDDRDRTALLWCQVLQLSCSEARLAWLEGAQVLQSSSNTQGLATFVHCPRNVSRICFLCWVLPLLSFWTSQSHQSPAPLLWHHNRHNCCPVLPVFESVLAAAILCDVCLRVFVGWTFRLWVSCWQHIVNGSPNFITAGLLMM